MVVNHEIMMPVFIDIIINSIIYLALFDIMFVIFVFRVQVVIKVVLMLAAGRMFLLLSKHEYVDNTMLGVHNSHTHVS